MPFKFINTEIKDVILIEAVKFEDSRGFFLESYKKSEFEKAGINCNFNQDNHSFSSRGVLRGLHFQNKPFEQAKLVRVVKGAVWDVAVDLRKNSPTYKSWVGVELTEGNGRLLFIPEGFAHGFITLKDNTHFLYKCSSEYAPEQDAGIRWDDPDIAIDWPVQNMNISLSDKDSNLPFLKELI